MIFPFYKIYKLFVYYYFSNIFLNVFQLSSPGQSSSMLNRDCQKVEELKRIVSLILSDPPCKDGNARFATVPLQFLSDLKY